MAIRGSRPRSKRYIPCDVPVFSSDVPVFSPDVPVFSSDVPVFSSDVPVYLVSIYFQKGVNLPAPGRVLPFATTKGVRPRSRPHTPRPREEVHDG